MKSSKVKMSALFVAATFTLVHSLPVKKNDSEIPTVCTTPQCLEMNEYLKSKIDFTKKPCEDFYAFACGKHTSYSNDVEKTQLIINEQVLKILDEFYAPDYWMTPKPNRALKMAKEMFYSCTHHGSYINDLKRIIDDKLGGWWLLDRNYNAKKQFNLTKFYTELIEMGYYPKSLFTVDVQPYRSNTTRKIITITNNNAFTLDGGFMDLPYDYAYNTNYMKFLIKAFSFHKDRARIDFERYEQMKQSVNEAHYQSGTSVIVGLIELKTDYPNIPWGIILEKMFAPTLLSDKEPISLTCKECIAALDELIGYTPTENLASFLMWSFVLSIAPEIDTNVEFEYWLFHPKSLKQDCRRKIYNLFKRALDYEYNRRYLNMDVKKEINEYAILINKALKKKINNDTTLDPATKRKLVNKAFYYLNLKIAYDEEIATQQQVEEYYADLTLNHTEEYFASIFEVSKFKNKKNVVSLREPFKPLYLQSVITSAGYDLGHNVVNLGASIMTGVFEPKCRPNYLNYGTIGFSIAHEIHHALDNVGYNYDERGNYNDDWLDWSAKSKYSEKFECIDQQYSTYVNVETGHKVIGKNILQEAFADNGGIIVAYDTYVRMIGSNLIKDASLPNFQQYNSRQMFWIRFATSMCKISEKGDVLDREKYATHPESRVRVLGVVKNNKDFAADFKCAPNTPMNPKRKCSVWG